MQKGSTTGRTPLIVGDWEKAEEHWPGSFIRQLLLPYNSYEMYLSIGWSWTFETHDTMKMLKRSDAGW